jgi:phage gp36-like protein
MVSKNIANYLLRPKKTPEQALKDYKKVVFLSKFLLAETQKAINDEKERFED